jgi:hypothetical protein
LWLCFGLYRVACLVWGLRRTTKIVRDAKPVRLSHQVNELWGASQESFGITGTSLLVSDHISTPATLGARRGFVLLPKCLLANVSESELAAIFAHEFAHIRRGDFLWNLLYEVLTVPVAYHPLTRLMRSRLEDSRELVCDELAAAQVGNVSSYACSLIRIAQSLSISSPPAGALGLFEGQDLPKRVATLVERRPRFGRRASAIAVIASTLLFGITSLAASAFYIQATAIDPSQLTPYVGTWHWMFDGKPFVTFVFTPKGDQLSGYMTNCDITLDENGNLKSADARPGTSRITRTFFIGSALHVLVQDDGDEIDEYEVTQVGPSELKFFPVSGTDDIPHNIKPWTATRASTQILAKPDANREKTPPVR